MTACCSATASAATTCCAASEAASASWQAWLEEPDASVVEVEVVDVATALSGVHAVVLVGERLLGRGQVDVELVLGGGDRLAGRDQRRRCRPRTWRQPTSPRWTRTPRS